MRVICILQKDLLLLPLLHLYPVENEHTWNERKKKKIRRKLEIAIECGSKITSFYHIFWPGWQCTLLLQQVTYLKIANAIWNNFLHCHPKFQFANFAPISYYIAIASKMQCVHDTHLLLALPFLITLETGLSMHLCIVQCSNQEMLELVLDGARKYSCNARPSLHVHHDASSKWFEAMFVRQMDG